MRRFVAGIFVMLNWRSEVVQRHLSGQQHSAGKDRQQKKYVLQAFAAHGQGTITETARGVLQHND